MGGLVSSLLGGALKSGADLVHAFKADPTIKLQLASQEQENALAAALQVQLAQIAADAAMQGAVNASMQAETKVGWFAGDWRAVWGYLSAFAFFAFVASILYAVIYAVTKDPSNVGAVGAAVSQMITVMTPVWAVPLAVLGVTAWHQGKADQEKAVQNGK